MYADADADRPIRRAGVAGSILDQGKAALEGAAGRREDDVKGVALGLDLGPAEARHGLAYE